MTYRTLGFEDEALRLPMMPVDRDASEKHRAPSQSLAVYAKSGRKADQNKGKSYETPLHCWVSANTRWAVVRACTNPYNGSNDRLAQRGAAVESIGLSAKSRDSTGLRCPRKRGPAFAAGRRRRGRPSWPPTRCGRWPISRASTSPASMSRRISSRCLGTGQAAPEPTDSRGHARRRGFVGRREFGDLVQRPVV